MPSKFGARKAEAGGHTFDSQAEARRYYFLLEQMQKGKITNLTLQQTFILQEGFRDQWHKWHAAITYTPDFVYTDERGQGVAEDVKGGKATITTAYRIRARLFARRYPTIRLVEVEA